MAPIIFLARYVSDRPLSLLLVDDDPIFALGLATVLSGDPEFQILGQLSSLAEVESFIAQNSPQILILEPMMVLAAPSQWQDIRRLRQRHPDLKIYLLSRLQARSQLLPAREMGIEGYAAKGISLERLRENLRQIANGGLAWEELSPTAEPAWAGEGRSSGRRRRPWLVELRQSGLRQIYGQLEPIDAYLRGSDLSLWDLLYWTGRRRELRMAGWLVRRLIPVEVVEVASPPPVPPLPGEASIVPAPESALVPLERGASAIERTLAHLRSPAVNRTKIPLEIDILLPEKRSQLLETSLERLSHSLNELKSYQLSPRQLPPQSAELLQDIWQDVALSFLAPLAPAQAWTLDDLQEQIEDYGELIQAEVLDKIPFLKEFWDYFLFDRAMEIDRVSYRPDCPEALERATLLIQNLTIAIANGVAIFLLNNFSEEEAIKQYFFQPNLRSYREVARFRNNLAWRYRRQQFFETPKNIFESQHPIFYFGEGGIQMLALYASRLEELQRLEGIPWAVTILLELRDAIAPRLRSAVEFLGNGVVYILTQVVGRAIGLVGRGIIQGVGNTWQDTRYGKNRERRNSQS